MVSKPDYHTGWSIFLCLFPGQGPFPAMLDLFGGLVSLVETRAALLASHGFVAFAVVYLYQKNLPQKLYDFNIGYIKVN